MKGCGRSAAGDEEYEQGTGRGEEGGNGWTERPMWTICRPVCSTLSHRDSPVLDSRPLLSCSPFPRFPSLYLRPVSPLLPRRPPRPLTFYHHNRYIIPRSVFYSRVAPWNAFVRDIVRASVPLPPPTHPSTLVSHPRAAFALSLFFPPSSLIFFFIVGYLIGQIIPFSLSTRYFFSFLFFFFLFGIRLWR